MHRLLVRDDVIVWLNPTSTLVTFIGVTGAQGSLQQRAGLHHTVLHTLQ